MGFLRPNVRRFSSSTTINDPPPPYSPAQTAPAPPPKSDRVPSTKSAPNPFPLGLVVANRRLSEPLVTTDEVRQHLLLLGAFDELRRSVQAQVEDGETKWEIADPSVRWSVFLVVAVERFEEWIRMFEQSEATTWERTRLPPLDVALVWHSYVLNPRWYQDDTLRVHHALRRVEGLCNAYPLAELSQTIDPLTFRPYTNQAQIDDWVAFAETPFDPVESFRKHNFTWFHDPVTSQNSTWPLYTVDGKGWAQQGFERSYADGFKETRETLCVRKLCRDIICCRNDEDAFFPGTVFHQEDGELSMELAQLVKKELFASEAFDTYTEDQLGEWFEWSLKKARTHFGVHVRDQATVRTIFSAYTTSSSFSLDLVTASLRQGKFISKMVTLGWTHQTANKRLAEEVLVRSVARYHAFLDLLACTPKQLRVPTLDIDLAWHTHQLNAFQYAHDTTELLGRFLDHDDTVESQLLECSYDYTAIDWKARFGVAYSICGCPLPDEAVLEKSSLFSLGFGKKKEDGPGPLLGDPGNAEDCDATHPSEHNSVIHSTTLQAHQSHRSFQSLTYTQRKIRDRKLAKKGTLSWETIRRQMGGHDLAFLEPVPTGACFGESGYPCDASGCVVTDAGRIRAEGSTAAGRSVTESKYAFPVPIPASHEFFLSPLDAKDGFLHLSTADQLSGTLGRFFVDVPAVTLLRLEYAKVAGFKVVKWEQAGSGGVYPHLYASLEGENVDSFKELFKSEGETWEQVVDGAVKEKWIV
ncbi:hypothetical protein MNV49_005523 [Pseudohyphozyma bogoriensis]|nr:hypothetical protein MNV49_005523 [Pseudohyphozyma bogoriensis]